MSDNRTTELLKDYAFALRRLEYDADKPGSNMTLGEYEAGEKRVTDEYAQAIAATMGSRTANVDDILELLDEMNHVESISYDVYSQLHNAIAELGSETCELTETASYSSANEVIHVLECSACGQTCEHVNGSYPKCPHCGARAVER